MRDLAAAGIVAGETGAASLAGLAEATGAGRPAGCGCPRPRAGTRVLLVCTEGATDPEAYHRIVEVPDMTTHPYGGPLIGLDGAVDLHCHPYPDLFPAPPTTSTSPWRHGTPA